MTPAAGRVEAIHVAARNKELPHAVERATVVAGKGIEGDRFFFPDGAPSGNALTLIAREALEDLKRDTGISLSPAESRRQVLTSGVVLNALVGRRFRVGEVECLGVELCEPCRHLAAMTDWGVLRGLVHRCGLNADVLTDGEIAVGDSVVALDGPPPARLG